MKQTSTTGETPPHSPSPTPPSLLDDGRMASSWANTAEALPYQIDKRLLHALPPEECPHVEPVDGLFVYANILICFSTLGLLSCCNFAFHSNRSPIAISLLAHNFNILGVEVLISRIVTSTSQNRYLKATN